MSIAVIAAGCSFETKDFDTLFGSDFSVDALGTAQSSVVLDRNGRLITSLRGEQNRIDVPIADIPEVVQNAVIAIEDERFWDHNGIDLKAILRAARSNVSAGGISEGGSTITQQYVGNVFLDRSDNTGSRKIEELFMALRFEQRYTKRFILERYLNWIYFGNGAYGIEAAARQYFGAPDCALRGVVGGDCLKVTELSLVEAATLAGFIQAPSRYNPYLNPDEARDRRDLVLLRMYANDYITVEEYEFARLEPIELVDDVSILEEQYPAAYFVEDVKQWFLDNEAFGETREDRARLLFEGGLTIHATIDLELQARTEAAVERALPRFREDGSENPDAAAVVMGTTPSDDGHILAMFGGRDFFGERDDAKFNLASGSGRQAGSAMKPIGLAAAVQGGIPVTSVWEAPSEIEIDNFPVCGAPWEVKGGAGDASVTLIRATRSSINTVYAQLIERIGPPSFVQMAERLGVGVGRIAPVCAAVLGTENVNMVELSTVFSTFKRSGVRVDPIIVTHITNPDGTLLYEASPNPAPVLSASVANQISWVLTGTIVNGTGTRAQLDGGRTAAGKTGTSQNNADATFVGYTAQRTAAVWVGYPVGQVPMTNEFGGREVAGGTFPALIWKEVMDEMHDGLPVEGFQTPPTSSTTTTLPNAPEVIVVPDLFGRTIDEELRLQMEEEFFTITVVERETADYEPGTIFMQVPAAGSEAPGDVVITVEIAVEPQAVPVPSVVGLLESEAKQSLASAGLGVDTRIIQNPESEGETRPGRVWAQNPVADTTDAAGQIAIIWVNPRAGSEDSEGL
ncbi:MAG: transglycosylase domain-containing protein [Acidimicrobiaceae bacterium]|nr:transglycosylase domain-containing protein [Acidimicrobiia bacterium]MCY4493941.1 transglycosylase domain-containing protein [Acidimicrobiaceae bacterium]